MRLIKFSKHFYKYLMGHEETRNALEGYEKRGGTISVLIEKQIDKFLDLVENPEMETSAIRRVEAVARTHAEHAIHPIWIIGGCLLYLEFLYRLTKTTIKIPEELRDPLYLALNKLVFRELGLMVNTYWEDVRDRLFEEKTDAEVLRNEIQSILGNIPQILWSVDISSDSLTYISPAFKSLCVTDTPHKIPCFESTLENDRSKVTAAWDRALCGETVVVDSRIRLHDGGLAWFRRKFIPALDQEGARVIRIDGIMEDITSERNTLEHLHRLATTDPLTGLLNRLEFQDRARAAMSASERSGRPVVMLLFDLDRFKVINDSLGHPIGDEVLRQAAGRTSALLRPSDGLARLGGDEFCLLIPEADDWYSTGKAVAERVAGCFDQPIEINGHRVRVQVSIGIATSVSAKFDIDELFRQCDVAMYAAKRSGEVYSLYQESMDSYGRERIRFEEQLRSAFDEGHFTLYYQPQVSVATRDVSSVEALIRWKRPGHGTVLPRSFLGEVETLRLMPRLTEYVFRNSFAQSVAWRKIGHHIKIFINVNAESLYERDFLESVLSLCGEYGVNPDWFGIEITEAVVLHDMSQTIEILSRFKDVGFDLALDDYGSGYSSLACLKNLPVRAIKIDKSFVLEMCRSEQDRIIVSSTIDLAHNLGFEVIAEGVEDEDTVRALQSIGCDQFQGYYLSKPLDPVAFAVWMRNPPLSELLPN